MIGKEKGRGEGRRRRGRRWNRGKDEKRRRGMRVLNRVMSSAFLLPLTPSFRPGGVIVVLLFVALQQPGHAWANRYERMQTLPDKSPAPNPLVEKVPDDEFLSRASSATLAKHLPRTGQSQVSLFLSHFESSQPAGSLRRSIKIMNIFHRVSFQTSWKPQQLAKPQTSLSSSPASFCSCHSS
jgi:hypothetical protein